MTDPIHPPVKLIDGMTPADNAKTAFERILYEQLIPAFCSDSKRGVDASGFVAASNHVGGLDARDFTDAWNAGIVEHKGRGLYRTANNKASEQFFWSGRNVVAPKTFTLWMEPVITVAALGRLHWRYGWPRHLIGTQSLDWAFDVVAMRAGDRGEYIAGEVKKTRREIDQLIELMAYFGRQPDLAEPEKSGKARNAYKKVIALRTRRAPIFWALGPEGYGKMFRVTYAADDSMTLAPADHNALRFPRN